MNSRSRWTIWVDVKAVRNLVDPLVSSVDEVEEDEDEDDDERDEQIVFSGTFPVSVGIVFTGVTVGVGVDGVPILQ